MTPANADSSLALAPFIRLIGEQTGLEIPQYQQKLLRQTLLKLATEQGLTDPAALLSQLRQSRLTSAANLTSQSNIAKTNPLWQTLINALTIGESSFFRDSQRIHFLKSFYLPQLVQKKQQANDFRLRIWSAGCAQGQELYTIAMLLEPLLGKQEPWEIDLIGTDINSNEVAAAIKAEYSSWPMRGMETFYQRCYFSKQANQHWQLNQDIKKNSRFFVLNLKDPYVSNTNNPITAVDLILCCNVFIYFAAEHIPPVLSKMADCLNVDGALVLAAADYPFDQMAQNFELNTIDKYPYFVKRSSLIPEFYNGQLEGLSTAAKIDLIESQWLTTKQTPAPIAVIDVKSHIEQLMQHGQWLAAIDAIKRLSPQVARQLPLVRHHANALANIGDLTGAAGLCRQGISLYPQDQILYLLSALACSGLTLINDAKLALDKALYIDPTFIDGHYHLALLMLKQGKTRQAKGCFKTALNLAKQRPDHEMTSLYPQTDMAAFKDSLQKENLK
ncbi:MAG: chemotaxis protein methyltransferase CheR [Phenylobacterium sp.]|jgi:chemotaxis protein methyltransferase CheR